MNTAACKSKISFIDGDKGILRYRGYPIEQLAEKSNFTEVSHCSISQYIMCTVPLFPTVQNLFVHNRSNVLALSAIVSICSTLNFQQRFHSLDDMASLLVHTRQLPGHVLFEDVCIVPSGASRNRLPCWRCSTNKQFGTLFTDEFCFTSSPVSLLSCC